MQRAGRVLPWNRGRYPGRCQIFFSSYLGVKSYSEDSNHNRRYDERARRPEFEVRWGGAIAHACPIYKGIESCFSDHLECILMMFY